MTHSVAPSRNPNTAPQRQIYERAPLLETIIEIKISSSKPPELSSLRAMRNGEENRYTTEQPVMEGTLGVEITGAGASVSSSTRQQTGYQWRNPAGSELFRATATQFSYHKLRPYTRWELCRDEARRLWEKYQGMVHPQSIGSLGLRYINRLDLPADGELSDYLLTAPQIAPGMHQILSGYMMTLTLPQPDLPNTMITLRQGTVESPSPQIASVVLDIDVIRTLERSTAGDQVWAAFEQLHERQNQVFELCITDRTRGLIS